MSRPLPPELVTIGALLATFMQAAMLGLWGAAIDSTYAFEQFRRSLSSVHQRRRPSRGWRRHVRREKAAARRTA